MSVWKTMGLVAVLVVAAWLLYPAPHQSQTDADGNVVEISFMGPGGPLAGALADAVREFERRSDQAHARDPSRPAYQVISGQNAARDQVADPTRFLISVAGDVPPDVIHFDRYAITEWAFRGAFAPLDDFIARDQAARLADGPDARDFYASCWDEAKYGGKVFGIPIGVDDRALYYNKDLLQRAGLVDERGQARWRRSLL